MMVMLLQSDVKKVLWRRKLAKSTNRQDNKDPVLT